LTAHPVEARQKKAEAKATKPQQVFIFSTILLLLGIVKTCHREHFPCLGKYAINIQPAGLPYWLLHQAGAGRTPPCAFRTFHLGY
jgi:hypothetical protein